MSGLAAADATAVVADPSEAGTVYGRGYFGTLQPGGLHLDRFEASYLLEMGRLVLTDSRGATLEWPSLFRRASRAESGFGVRYLVYRDLRQRGYVVRATPPPVAFAALPRGGVLHKTPSKFWIEPFSERVPFDVARLFDLAERAQAARKTLLLGVVDEESDLTYYRIRRPSPVGSHVAVPLSPPATGWVTEDRVVVFDPEPVATLGGAMAYGSRVGARLELSVIEAAHLLELGELQLRDARGRRTIESDRFLARASRLDRRFRERLGAYRDLRARKLIVKTGFKYGSHFRGYPRNPETAHARYLIQAVRTDHVTAWPEIAGAVRVAQGVRKEFLLAAVPDSGAVIYLSLERVRP
ncbi:MAG: tRNA-intron lyase [Thermoplasmata archaeon]|nr:tRNA-intron lyase [Thermoplasmata archaeon]